LASVEAVSMNTTSGRPRWQAHLPMFFTYLRMAMAPLVMGVMYIPWSWAGWTAAIIFILGSLTDWVDGYLARKLKVESTAGQLMDPIADKVLVLGAIVMLLAMGRVDAITVFLLLARDILIGGIRSVAAAQQIIIAAKPFGKWKTGLQMVAIPCLLVFDPLWGVVPVARIGQIALWLSVVLSLVSAAEYILGYVRKK